MTQYRKAASGGIYCTVDEEIARMGQLSIRRVNSDPPWFDLWFDNHIHLFGTLDQGAAWQKLLGLDG